MRPGSFPAERKYFLGCFKTHRLVASLLLQRSFSFGHKLDCEINEFTFSLLQLCQSWEDADAGDLATVQLGCLLT